MTSSATNLVVLLGATATGKTRLAVEAARLLQAEIISADSRQVYRGMDLGTGKDLAEYEEIPYHLIDIVDPGYEFNVFEFQQRFCQAFETIEQRGHLPLLCGGTGLYLDAVLGDYRLAQVPHNDALRQELEPLDDEQLRDRLVQLAPNQHNDTDLQERERTIRAIEIASAPPAEPHPVLEKLQPLVFGLHWERSVIRKRITARLKQRLDEGMIDEVARLHEQGTAWETLEFYGLEYRFIAQHLQGKLNRNDMVQKLNSAIHKFAKRQETWFRRMEKRGCTIHWLQGDQQPLAQMMEIISRDNESPERDSR
ncbi:tRNA (adenosine(37)-N6)-dimethylallyltransferase MiaA [Desulfuromonas acetoxidans]|nr:tRNA (adenosine(37)-N6)-dimethylallyltransferase MiaA [Desulfuromonas acetoxidans]MBF0645410.1 tRNA (adenosine(37)-N6)-dimethylallyltransferase MiaA [Desulfuromonas acetoxidans]NVD24216.1 tRNA (adenosine(37)-N6)-dimethylallyltransferase MiaA [Desulfuromonas acetoxidans]NVE15011.1 tRNA (adenosine(37)-N6)-dimethylallyltransferase MiaA [Desulfuromonas acetoxidans]